MSYSFATSSTVATLHPHMFCPLELRCVWNANASASIRREDLVRTADPTGGLVRIADPTSGP